LLSDNSLIRNGLLMMRSLNAKTRLVGRVCLLLTALIIRLGGKPLCHLRKSNFSFVFWRLRQFWWVEGLDKANLPGKQGNYFSGWFDIQQL
jgi:hypothetical protein